MTGHVPIRDRRAAKYARGGFDECYLCSDKPRQLHHTSYRPEEVVAVCTSCHASIHSNDPPDDSLVPDTSRPEDYGKVRREEERQEKGRGRFLDADPSNYPEKEVEEL